MNRQIEGQGDEKRGDRQIKSKERWMQISLIIKRMYRWKEEIDIYLASLSSYREIARERQGDAERGDRKIDREKSNVDIYISLSSSEVII